MKAIQITSVGGPEVLTISEVTNPAPGAGEVLVRVHTSGINFIDVYYREGKYKGPLPFVLGGEGAGVVEAIGPGVELIAVGDRVAWTGPLGSYAQFAIINEQVAVTIPKEISFETACALMMQGMTAHYLACSTYELTASDTALVHAAAGGVGSMLTQIAKLRGARVIATVSNQEKAGIAKDNGADEVILYSESDFEAETKRLTAGKGVDVVYDGVGVTTFEKSLRSLRARGMLALYGAASGPVPPFDLSRLSQMGSLFITRPISTDYLKTRDERLKRAEDLFAWFLEGKLRVHIDRIYPLSEVAQAHRDLESRKTSGKLLLSI